MSEVLNELYVITMNFVEQNTDKPKISVIGTYFTFEEAKERYISTKNILNGAKLKLKLLKYAQSQEIAV